MESLGLVTDHLWGRVNKGGKLGAHNATTWRAVAVGCWAPSPWPPQSWRCLIPSRYGTNATAFSDHPLQVAAWSAGFCLHLWCVNFHLDACGVNQNVSVQNLQKLSERLASLITSSRPPSHSCSTSCWGPQLRGIRCHKGWPVWLALMWAAYWWSSAHSLYTSLYNISNTHIVFGWRTIHWKMAPLLMCPKLQLQVLIPFFFQLMRVSL